MSDIKQPQDRKQKVTKFSFTAADGTEHTLPLASDGASKVPGKFTRDAVMDGDDAAELRLSFALLEACGADQKVIDALYSLPNKQMLETLGDWMTHGDGKGATIPQS